MADAPLAQQPRGTVTTPAPTTAATTAANTHGTTATATMASQKCLSVGKDLSRVAFVVAALFLSLTNIFTQQVVTDSQRAALMAAAPASAGGGSENLSEQQQRRQQQRQEGRRQKAGAAAVDEPSLWKNDLNLVHVIHTRFMQHQPHLVHLGRARLELFKAFCLPTIKAQTNQQFLWIIRVDPELPRLNPSVAHELLELVAGLPNAVVAGSNARVDDGFFRHPNATIDLFGDGERGTASAAAVGGATNASVPSSPWGVVWHGNLDLVRDYRRASLTRTLLETGLDADDGLAVHYVDAIQKEAYKSARAVAPQHPQWFRIVCVKPYTVWQFWGPYESSTMGSLRSHPQNPRKFCLTPGLTRISSHHFATYQLSPSTYNEPDRDFSGLPREGYRFFVDHFYIDKHLPHCRKRGKSARPHACYAELDGTRSLALRTRTPTSASLTDVLIPPVISQRARNEKELSQWDRALRLFGLDLREVTQARFNLNATLDRVLEDAASGYCTIGHSCMEKTRDVLRNIRAAVASAGTGKGTEEESDATPADAVAAQ